MVLGLTLARSEEEIAVPFDAKFSSLVQFCELIDLSRCDMFGRFGRLRAEILSTCNLLASIVYRIVVEILKRKS